MQASLALFRFVAKTALGCAGFGVAGEFVAEVLPDMARTLYQRWAAGRPAAEVRAEVRAAARLDDEAARRFATIVADEAGPDVTPDIHLSLVSYLSLIPSAIRQTQRGAGDVVIARPVDVLKLLPARLPRFAKGQRARGFPDWTLDELLGVGGFGEVWKATNPHLPPVALKFCLDEAAARFLRHEADLLGRIVRHGRHPGVVALLDTALSTDPPCLKYEFVPGGDLAALVRGWRGPAADRARPLVRQLAEAVASAHRLDPPVVHRDLKPANVLVQHDLDGEMVLRVADFGIGAIVSVPTAQGPTALLGACTPLYASPQQLRGDEPSPADDVFALGVLWFQMLVGDLDERPGTDWREALAGRGAGPDEMDLLGRCLVGRADRRLRDAAALLDALDALEGHAPEPAPEAEDDIDGDDPLAIADRLQRSLREAQSAVAQARELAEKRHDYAAAVRRLERIPDGFRDPALVEAYRERRDRIYELRRQIYPAARRGHFVGLHDRIADLLALTPGDGKVRRLLDVVPYCPGPEVVNGVGVRLVLIPAGTFAMGSPHGEAGRQACEGPVRPVAIARPFYLGAWPVTQSQFERVMGVNPARFRHVAGHDTTAFPVENVTWHEADEFCRRLSALPGEAERGRRYRLPAEAEWEYACRAGGDASHPFSTGRSLCSAQANFDGRRPYGHAPFGEFRARATRAGAFAANAWGLFDMHGNVWEWCADRFTGDGEARVMRGGSWQNHAASCRSASRDWIGPGYRGCTVGFRVVLEVAG